MSPQQQNMTFSKKDILNALTNQKSSIFLQGTIREMNPIEIANFIKAITGNFTMVMNDKNGNYLCSDLFKVCSPYQRITILKEIFNDIDEIAIHDYGTHPAQTLIELAKTQEEIMLITNSLADQNKMLKVALVM